MMQRVRILGGLLREQPRILQRISTAARGSQKNTLVWARPLSSLPGAAVRRTAGMRPVQSSRTVFPSRAAPRRTFHSSKARRSQSAKGEAAEEKQTLSGRLKKLSREYGWAAVGVYLGLSALDFPFCFLFVRTVGTDKIAEFEHLVVTKAKEIVPESVKGVWRSFRGKPEGTENEDSSATGELAAEGLVAKREASLATQLALAYAIHKSFIFIRVPLTAAVTPKVVKVLRSWGWKVGKSTPK